MHLELCQSKILHTSQNNKQHHVLDLILHSSHVCQLQSHSWSKIIPQLIVLALLNPQVAFYVYPQHMGAAQQGAAANTSAGPVSVRLTDFTPSVMHIRQLNSSCIGKTIRLGGLHSCASGPRMNANLTCTQDMASTSATENISCTMLRLNQFPECALSCPHQANQIWNASLLLAHDASGFMRS